MNLSKNVKSKIEVITLKIFFVCMIACACMVLIGLWTRAKDDFFFPIVPTLFVVGLTNFLVWLPIVLYRLLDALKNK